MTCDMNLLSHVKIIYITKKKICQIKTKLHEKCKKLCKNKKMALWHCGTRRVCRSTLSNEKQATSPTDTKFDVLYSSASPNYEAAGGTKQKFCIACLLNK